MASKKTEQQITTEFEAKRVQLLALVKEFENHVTSFQKEGGVHYGHIGDLDDLIKNMRENNRYITSI